MASKAKKTAVKKKSVKPAAKKAAAKPAAKKIAKTSAKKVVAKATAKKTAKKTVAKVKAPTKKVTAKKAIATKAAPKVAKKVSAAKPVKTLASAKSVAAKKVDYSKAITPLADRLVIRVAAGGERVTAGGLIIPDMVSTAVGHLKGEVLAVGPGAKNKKGATRPLDVQVGDQVLFSEHAGAKIQFNAEDLQIIHESDVMGIVEK